MTINIERNMISNSFDQVLVGGSYDSTFCLDSFAFFIL